MGNLIKIEDALEIIDSALVDAESKFYAENGRYPDLHQERDYFLLAKHLNIDPSADGALPIDSSYRLIRRFMERQDLFRDFGSDRELAFDAFMGRVEYNPPRREIEFRLSKLDDLQKLGYVFPSDWENFKDTVGGIRGIYPKTGPCFMPETKEVDPEAHRKAYNNIGHHLVNPSAGFYNTFKDTKSYEDVKSRLEGINTPKGFLVYE